MSSFEDNLRIVGVDDLAQPDAEGYLEKKRKDKKFRSEKLQKRWCVVHGGNFYYFSKCTDIRQKGSFSLNGYSFRKRGDLSFAIVCEGKRQYEFVAPSKDEVEKFKNAIIRGKAYSKKKLKKSDSCPDAEPSPPISPARDRSTSIPIDKRSQPMPYKSKTRSHTPDPFQRSTNTSSQYMSNTLGRSDFANTRTDSVSNQLKKSKSSPYGDRSTSHKRNPQLPTQNKPIKDEYGYVNVGSNKKGLSAVDRAKSSENLMKQQQFSSSDDSDSDYDTVPESVPPKPAPRHKQFENVLSVSGQKSTSLPRQKMPTPCLTSQSHVSSDDEEDYDSPEDLPLRPESDYDFVGKFHLPKPKTNFVTKSDGEDDCYIDPSKLDSVPNTNRQQKLNKSSRSPSKLDTQHQPFKAPSKLDTQEIEDDIYFEPTSEFGHAEQNSRSQIQSVLQTDDEDPYFIPIEESGHSGNDASSHFQPNSGNKMAEFDDENPYFDPISDHDVSGIAVAGLFQKPKSVSPITRTNSQENDGYSKGTRNTKMANSRNSDGYSKPEEMLLLKRKPATAPTSQKKSDPFTDDSAIYVNLPFATQKGSQSKQTNLQAEQPSTLQSKNTTKLQNMKLKDSVEDSSYSDSDDYDYFPI